MICKVYRFIKSRVECSLKRTHCRRHLVPGWLSVVADKLSRLDRTTQTEWSLLQEVFQAICNRWHRPQIDLFATRFNNKLPSTGSPGYSSECAQFAMVGSGSIHLPTISHIGQAVMLQDSPYKRIILIAPGWPIMPWFWDPVAMSSQIPLSLPNLPNLLTQPLGTKLWNALPAELKNASSLKSFAAELSKLKCSSITLSKSTHNLYSHGSRIDNINHACLRMGCSKLNVHLMQNLHVIDH